MIIGVIHCHLQMAPPFDLKLILTWTHFTRLQPSQQIIDCQSPVAWYYINISPETTRRNCEYIIIAP